MTLNRTRRRLAVAAAGLLAAFALTACGGKQVEQFQDAKVASRDTTPAQVFDMPDGFSNFAEKCDGHGFRVFVAFHNDGKYAAITAVADPTCGR